MDGQTSISSVNNFVKWCAIPSDGEPLEGG